MPQIYPKILRESLERQRDGQRVNPASVAKLHYRQRVYMLPLSSGESDSVYFFRNGREVRVLSINERYGYCGMQVYELNDTESPYYRNAKRYEADQVAEFFSQSEDEMRELVGPRGLDYSPTTLVARLSEYVTA